MRNANQSVDWDKLLAEDGSLPYVPHEIDGEVPAVEPMPVMTTPPRVTVRRRGDDGIEVIEATSNLSGIVEAVLYVETRWTCVGCKKHFRKPGRHNGVLRTCKACGVRYFLRVVPIG
jgi:DNA-directed RNA polymerase subunit RPC12/RpoP